MKQHQLETLRNQYGVKKNKTLYETIGARAIFEEIKRRHNRKLIIQYESENPEAICDFIGGEMLNYSGNEELFLIGINNQEYKMQSKKIIDVARPSRILADSNMDLKDYVFFSNEGTPIKFPAKNPFEAYWRLYQSGKVNERTSLLKAIQQENERTFLYGGKEKRKN